jgi:hypothetical protein
MLLLRASSSLTVVLAFAVTLLGAAGTAGAAESDVGADRADVVGQEVPEAMEVGQSYSVIVKLRNTGSSTWTRQDGYSLSTRQRHWSTHRVELDAGEKVAPGDTATFKFRVTAPGQSGIYDFQWQLQHEDRVFGPPTALHRIVVESGSNRVKFIGQVVPSVMDVGGEYTVMVQFKNLGKTTWSGGSGFKLVARNPANNQTWGINRVPLDAEQPVPPGGIANIRFKIKAPLQAGEYDFQWQLHQDKLGFFGEPTPNQRIQVGGAGVGNDAEFVLQELPGLVNAPAPYAVIKRGSNFQVKLMFKNVGTTTWTAGAHRLTSQKPRNNLTWFLNGADLNQKEEVKPGEFKTFSFTAVAPSQPGIYDFEWQMYQEGIGWFGAPSQTVKITVR